MSNIKRSPAWFPYLQSAEIVKKGRIKFVYQGGEEESSPDDLSSIMIYGTEVNLPLEVMEAICSRGVPIILIRRNVASPIWIHSGTRANSNTDILSRQVEFRNNQVRSRYITRRLLEEKFKAMRWLIAIPDGLLRRGMSIEQMRNIEAVQAKRYWGEYMKGLGVETGRRDKESQVREVLDIASKFVSGIMLRWVLYHHLSPFHGFCHSPIDYIALVYDLMEPYRPGLEKHLYEFLKTNPGLDEKYLLSATVKSIQEYQDSKVYTASTRQIVTRHELYHGLVLALRSYLLGESKKLTIPVEDRPNGGRPRKVGFRLYGRSAGKTDFWGEAKSL